MKLLSVIPVFFGLDFAATFALDGISHLTGAWPWFIPLAVAALAGATLGYMKLVGLLDEL